MIIITWLELFVKMRILFSCLCSKSIFVKTLTLSSITYIDCFNSKNELACVSMFKWRKFSTEKNNSDHGSLATGASAQAQKFLKLIERRSEISRA